MRWRLILTANFGIFSCLFPLSLARLRAAVERPSNIKHSGFEWLLAGVLTGMSLLFLNGSVGSAAQIPAVELGEPLKQPRVCLPSQAEEYLDQHKWTEARDCYLDIVKLDSGAVTVWAGLATSLVYLGHRDEALKQLCNAMGHVAKSQRPELLKRIRVLSRLFLANTAFQTYQDGLILLASRKFNASQEKFKTALNEEVDNVEVLMRMGQSTFLNGDRQKSVVHFRMARHLDPFDPEIRLWLGKALQSQGDTREALVELKEAYSYFKESNKEIRGDLGKNSEAAAVWYSDALVGDGQTGLALRILTQDFKSDASHLSSLLAATQLRMQANKADSTSWKTLRKDLNLALKRLEQAKSPESTRLSQIQDSLAFVQDKTPEIIKAEILGFLKQMDQFRPSRRS